MSETARQEWKPQLATRAGAYHRVERVGAHPTEEPVALVKDARHAQAIALLPKLAAFVHDLVQLHDAGGALPMDAARALVGELAKVRAPL